MIELIDFTATVFEMTGIEPGYTHFGKSLTPVIEGKTDELRDAVFCEGGRMPDEKHCNEYQSKSAGADFLYSPRISLQLGDGPEHSKAVMCRTKEYKGDIDNFAKQAEPAKLKSQWHPALDRIWKK